MSKKKLITSLIFFVSLVVATFYCILSKNDIHSIWQVINSIDCKYIILAVVLVVGYFFMQGLYMKLMLKTLNVKIPILTGMFYSIVEFFFSAVTPSSTGGQPVQLYYMSKDRIPKGKSLIVLILNTIMFKLFIIVFGFLILIFYRELIFDNIYASILFWIGMIVDIAVVYFGYLLIFSQKTVKKIIGFSYKIVCKITKKEIDYEDKIREVCDKYNNNAMYIKSHKKEVFLGTIITFIQRILMFSITFVIYVGLNLRGMSYFHLLLLQIYTQITIEALPLPGGTGAMETIINNVYLSIFGSLTVAGTILVRSCTFYIPLIITMILIIIFGRRNGKRGTKGRFSCPKNMMV